MRFWLNCPFSRNIFVQKNEDIFEILFKLQLNCIMSHKRYTVSQKILIFAARKCYLRPTKIRYSVPETSLD